LFARNTWVLCGRIARSEKPNGPNDQPETCAYTEGCSPAIVKHQEGDERRRKACACAHAGECPSVSDTTHLGGNPGSQQLIGGSDRCSLYGDVHAIQECDGAKNEQPEDKEPTKGARLLAGHLWSFALQPLLE